MISVMTVGLLTAGFLPLPPPSMTSAQVADLIAENPLRIRAGMVLLAIGAAFLGPFIAVLTVQLRRIEGRHSPLSWLNLAFGTLFVFEFILPCFVCLAAAYRPERSPEVTQALFDLCWLMFVGVVSTAVVQCVAIALVILGDHGARPVFPRWVGMFNLFTAITFGAGVAVAFFKTGPLAWNGVIAFWVPLAVYTGWLFVMLWALLRAIGAQEAAAGTEDDDLDVARRLELLTDEVAALRAESAGRV
jgi:hypothetical protein